MDKDERDMRAALQYAVGEICRHEEEHQDDDATSVSDTRMSSQAVAALTELVYQYATTSLSNDLVSFSCHANRRTVNADDVKLVLRKDPDHLLASLERFCDKSKGDPFSRTAFHSGSKRTAKKSGSSFRIADDPWGASRKEKERDKGTRLVSRPSKKSKDCTISKRKGRATFLLESSEDEEVDLNDSLGSNEVIHVEKKISSATGRRVKKLAASSLMKKLECSSSSEVGLDNSSSQEGEGLSVLENVSKLGGSEKNAVDLLDEEDGSW